MARLKKARTVIEGVDDTVSVHVTPREANLKTRKKAAQRSGEIPASSHVYNSVKQQLLDGRFQPGEWLQIDELATQFDVSRQPVMDAIKRLTIEGFVEIVPQVGSRVRQYSSDDIVNFFDLFALTESHIARTAAIRADQDDILELRLVSAQLGVLTKLDSSQSETIKLYRSLNRKLHAALSNSTKSQLLGEMVEGLRDRADFFITTHAGLDQRLSDAITEHEDIVDAIAARQSQKAADIMHAHVLAFTPRTDSAKHVESAS